MTKLEFVLELNDRLSGLPSDEIEECIGFYVEMIDSTYGAYVSAIGSIKESTADKMYVIVYTSVASDSYEGAPTVQYDGMTLYQAGIGLSGMQVSEGGVILFRLEKSPY